MSEPTVRFRLDSATREHVHLSVFVGRQPGARARVGVLSFATAELVELLSPAVVEQIVGSAHLVLRGAVDIPDPRDLDTVRAAVQRMPDDG